MSAMHTRVLLVVAALLFLNACTYYTHTDNSDLDPSERPPEQSLAQTTVCCDSYAELEFKNLPPKFDATLFLDADDPAMVFTTGKSYVEPLLLPETSGIILLQIDSLVSKHSPYGVPTAVFPVVTLLDSQYQPVATLDQLPFEYQSKYFDSKRIRFVVTIDGQYEDVTYALIHTSSEKLNQSLSIQEPIQIVQDAGFETILYAEPSFSRKRIRFVESGVFNVKAFPLDQS